MKPKSQNFVIQQKEELFWAEIFIYYINFSGGFDYEVVPFSTDIIDTKGISRSENYPELNMQKTWVKEIEFNPNRPVTKYLFFKKEDVKEAIERKTSYYLRKGEDISNIILLLQGYMSQIWAKDIITNEFCRQYESNPFKGIYYLVRPSSNSNREEDPKDGSVLPIKCYWEK